MESHRSDRPTEHASEGTPVPSATIGGWSAGALAGAVLLAAGACAESSIGGTALEKSGRISLSHEVPAANASSSARAGGVRADVTIGDGPQIVVDSIDVVIRQVQVGREGTECAFRPQGVASDEDESDCEEFGTGVTIAQSLPVDEGLQTLQTNVPIEPGTWDRLEFAFNVLQSDASQPEDLDILSGSGGRARTDLRGGSVMIQGAFDGQDFTLLLELDGEVTVPAETPLVIDEEGQGGVVLVWNVAQWFDDGEGGIVDPVAAQGEDGDQQIRDQIESNIPEALALETTTGG